MLGDRNLNAVIRAVAFAMVLTVLFLGCGQDGQVDRNASQSAAGTVPVPSDAAGDVITGTVAETMDSGGYTYALVKGKDTEVWAAGPLTKLSVGHEVTIRTDMAMPDFHSETLNRSFDVVYFVTSFGASHEGGMGGPNMSKAMKQMHGGRDVMGGEEPSTPASGTQLSLDKQVSGEVEKAPGGLSVAEVYSGRSELAGQKVTVRGVVVKFTPGIMGTNWLHLQDGSCADNVCDLAVTTDETVSEGDVVTLEGVLAVDKDFGAGYRYEAIVQGAVQLQDG